MMNNEIKVIVFYWNWTSTMCCSRVAACNKQLPARLVTMIAGRISLRACTRG